GERELVDVVDHAGEGDRLPLVDWRDRDVDVLGRGVHGDPGRALSAGDERAAGANRGVGGVGGRGWSSDVREGRGPVFDHVGVPAGDVDVAGGIDRDAAGAFGVARGFEAGQRRACGGVIDEDLFFFVVGDVEVAVGVGGVPAGVGEVFVGEGGELGVEGPKRIDLPPRRGDVDVALVGAGRAVVHGDVRGFGFCERRFVGDLGDEGALFGELIDDGVPGDIGDEQVAV